MQAEPAQVIGSCESEMAWLGEQIELIVGSCQVCGKFVGLKSCGSLILQTESETKAMISARMSVEPSQVAQATYGLPYMGSCLMEVTCGFAHLHSRFANHCGWQKVRLCRDCFRKSFRSLLTGKIAPKG